MPGIIQVSVLDFAGSHSSSPDPQISIKVSMGKREFETWEKGEFSFPLTSMRDNLVVILQDNHGNAVSRTEVETRLVIEKGVWDNVFTFQGGGHVHMNLQFVLSEEDREKIRATRQLALRKKHEELLKKEATSPAVAATNAGRMVQPTNEAPGTSSQDPQEIPSRKENPAELFKKGKRSPEYTDIGQALQKQLRPNDADTHEETSSTSLARQQQFEVPSVSSAALERIQVKPKGHEVNEPEKHHSVEKIHSNIRNMISVFESRPHQQDTDPRARLPTTSTTVQSSKDKVDASSETGSVEGKITGKGEQVGLLRALSRSLVKDEDHAEKDLKNNIKVDHMEDNIEERSSTGRRASVSGKVPDELPSRRSFSNFFARRRNSGVSLLPRGSGEGTKPRISNEIDVKQLASNEHHLHESSGAWIFPDEGRRQCFTTASKTITSLTGDSPVKEASYTEESTGQENSVHGEPPTRSKELRPVLHGVEDPADGEGSTGPLGQVIKAAIVVGFATLVVLTRQRNPDR